jgi:DNA-binding transcriptional regulator YiaG
MQRARSLAIYSLRVTQVQFIARLGFAATTLRHWERGDHLAQRGNAGAAERV